MKKKNNKLNIKIGANSANRCWFLCILYWFIGEANFLKSLTQFVTTGRYGYILLRNILITLKCAIIQQNQKALACITQYIEAFLQGHYCLWGSFEPVETGLRIVRRMCPQLFKDSFVVEFDEYSVCSNDHIFETISRRAYQMDICDIQSEWNEDNGIVTCTTQTHRKCVQLIAHTGLRCGEVTNERKYKVTSPIKQSFIVHFEHGIPTTLWDNIMSKHDIYFGSDFNRQIGGAIFRINQSHYVAAYLLFNPKSNDANNDPANLWIKMETSSKEIQIFEDARAEDCRYIFVHAPEKSCPSCEDYDTFPWTMTQCNKCNKWMHQRCTYLIGNENVVCSNCLIYFEVRN